MRLATLFSGIGAPEYASLGRWEHIFAAEIDKYASAVLSYNFPELTNLGDVLQLDGAKYRNAVDIIVGGSPCQGFSISGYRRGLDDVRSNLAIRFIEILAQVRPTWFLWENVPGVFSCNHGRDFAAILGCFTGRAISVPWGGKWKNTGLISGIPEAYSVAWRVFDAQYFGVPQRRRRIFLVGYLGEEWRPPAAVLLNPQGLQRYSNQGRAKGIHTAQALAAGTGTSDPERETLVCFSSSSYGQDSGIDIAPTLKSVRSFPTIIDCATPRTIVRRLTPKECERLQGFPDDWTHVPFPPKNKMIPKTQRYKLLGNSIATPCLKWIFDRIEEVDHFL